MRFFRILLFLLSAISLPAAMNAQTKPQVDKKIPSYGGIINGRASHLPKPVYSEEARRYCADGKVEVEVLVSEDGTVISAKVISGDEFLLESSVAAAKQARFRNKVDGPPVKVRGQLIYNFDHFSKCIKVGIVNKKAILIPKPVAVRNILHPSHLRLSKDAIVNVEIVINESGNVISARATSGHPLLRSAFERSASGARFSPTNFGPLKVKSILSYRIKPNGEIEY